MHNDGMPSEPLPFLPEPEPVTPPAAPKKTAWKTFLLWLALIVMFLFIWQLLAPDPHAMNEPALPPCAPPPAWRSAIPYVACIAIIFFACRWFYRSYALSLDFNLAQEPGRIAMAEGRLGAAIEVFTRTQAAYAKKAAYEGAANLALGHAQIWAGRLDEAIATFATIERMRANPFQSSIRTIAAVQLAFTQALAGQLEASERWAKETRARLAKNRDDRIDYAARLCLAEAVVFLRRRRPEDASALLERNWTIMREILNGNTMRMAEVISAFAESARGVRQSNTMAERLLRVEPTLPGDFAFLGVKWPEMQTFLDAHGLGNGPR